MIKTGDRKYAVETEALTIVRDQLEKGVCARNIDLSDEHREVMDGLFLLTAKPVIYAANIAKAISAKTFRKYPACRSSCRWRKTRAPR